MPKELDRAISEELREYLRGLDARIRRIEEHLQIVSRREPPAPVAEDRSFVSSPEREEALEYKIGQYWFTKVGIIVLAIGIAFLLTFPYRDLPPAIPSIIGYAITAGIVGLAHYLRKSFTYISRYLVGGGLVLLYFSTLRLSFFSQQPAIASATIHVALLSAVVGANLVISAKRTSVYLTGLSLTMGYLTALVSREPTAVLLLIVAVVGATVYLQVRYRWNRLAVYSMSVAYWTFFLLVMNNPLLGNEPRLVLSPHSSVYFLLLYCALFAVGNLLRVNEREETLTAVVSTFVNSIGCYGLFLVLTLVAFREQVTLSHLVASVVFLTLSVVFWLRQRSRYATFFYAMLGYLALSVSILNQFDLSDALTWLSWQSILVITTAIWFRSKYIVVANFVIYLIVLIAFVGWGGVMSWVSLSFGFIALLSARIMNAQQHRLELKTEMMRNAYLAAAFCFFPFALYRLVPREFVALSWVGVAIMYYALNLVLQKQKYRWMAVMTLLLTVAYLLVIGIISLEPTYRIVSFIFLGVVLLGASMVYTRMRAKKKEDSDQQPTSTQGPVAD